MSDAAPPADPAPTQAPEPRSGGPRLTFGRSVLLAAAFALLVLAALLLWVFRQPLAERLSPPPEPPPATSDTAALRARIADLETSLAQARQAAAARQSGDRGDFDAALDARVTALEAAQGRANRAAAAAVAASLVAEAAERGAPFTRELAALERLDPSGRLTAGLRETALTGAPSRAAIGGAFAAASAEAASAARAGDSRPGALSRAFAAVGRVFTLRRIDGLSGTSPDAVLARAERRAAQGDLEGALVELEALSASGQAALADWRALARQRIELDRRVAALRLQALEELAGTAAGAPALRGATP